LLHGGDQHLDDLPHPVPGSKHLDEDLAFDEFDGEAFLLEDELGEPFVSLSFLFLIFLRADDEVSKGSFVRFNERIEGERKLHKLRHATAGAEFFLGCFHPLEDAVVHEIETWELF